MNEIFPVHKVDEVLPFGKYKGKTIEEIYSLTLSISSGWQEVVLITE